MQLFNLNNYMYLSIEEPKNTLSSKLDLHAYSRGMGGLGIPGDLSSMSRFVKAVFTKVNSLSSDDEISSVSQFFHILGSVYQQRGCVHMGEDKYEITIYSSCCNQDKGIYYYKTYDNSKVNGIDMHKEDLDSNALISYELVKLSEFKIQN